MLVDSHPAGGYFELRIEEDLVVMDCHWPFDLNRDEWIDIQNRYRMPNYRRAVSDAMENGSGEVQGIAGGTLQITSLDDGFAIEFSRPQHGWSASSLELHVKRPVSDLLPRWSGAPRWRAHAARA